MNLIPEGFSGWWKKYSAAALTAIGALQTAWMMSADLQKMLTPKQLAVATFSLAVLGFIGRFISQTKETKE